MKEEQEQPADEEGMRLGPRGYVYFIFALYWSWT